MNNDNFKTEVYKRHGRHRRNQVLPGIFLLIVGGLLLANAAGVDFPHWFFSWPMLLIGISTLVAFSHRFRPGPWMVLMLIGGVFLFDKIDSTIELRPYLWPALFIIIGLAIIFKPRNKHYRLRDDEEVQSSQPSTATETTSSQQGFSDYSDVLDMTAVFAGIKKKVLSKKFAGGEVVAVMGGAEINLEQADFNGRIKIEMFNMFGGTKLIVPPDWEVQSEVVAIFGGVEDKRPPASNHDRSKVLFLEGTCIFGGIEIRSF